MNENSEQSPTKAHSPAQSGFAELHVGRIVFYSIAILLCIDVALFLLDIFVSFKGVNVYRPVRRLFNITREDSIGTWYSSTQTLVIAVVLWLQFAFSRFEKRAKKTIWAWGALAVLFTYIAVDDGSRLHETIGVSLYASTGAMPGAPRGDQLPFLGKLLDLFPSYPWQVVFAPIFGAGALLLLYVMVKEIGSRGAQIAVFAGLSCLVLGVGLDFLEGLPEMGKAHFADFLPKKNSDGLHYSKAIEELIEMVGMTLILMGFLINLLRSFPVWRVRFK